MGNRGSFISFIAERYPDILKLISQHIQITGMAVLLAVFVGIPKKILLLKRVKVWG